MTAKRDTNKVTPKRKPGRPSKLTPQLTAKIAKSIRDGLYIESACAFHGVGRSTVYRWLELADGADGTEPEPLYEEFRDTIAQAAAQNQHRLIKRVEAGKFGWQGALALLGLRHPDQYSQKIREAKADERHEVFRRLAEKLSPVDYAKTVAAYTGALTAPQQRPPVEDMKRLISAANRESEGFMVRILGPLPNETGEHYPELVRTDAAGRRVTYVPKDLEQLPDDRRDASVDEDWRNNMPPELPVDMHRRLDGTPD